eukprot:CAMPEP_0170749606 /NCGR_PEP_ID=MMETSP0437-20130122/10483_1 /TAXON_ID=0 /ORGANISM="Sexangularia sp." /LENGTH=91 /DNA_ID=CAMNT_0011088537 /DNA_START=67 /DNA_END=338 /DNA_ORIENTATION=+
MVFISIKYLRNQRVGKDHVTSVFCATELDPVVLEFLPKATKTKSIWKSNESALPLITAMMASQKYRLVSADAADFPTYYIYDYHFQKVHPG